MGLQTEDVIHNNLAGQAHHLLFLHVRPANQPKIRAAYIYHKRWDTLGLLNHMSTDINHLYCIVLYLRSMNPQ